ncbi:hypothetical protein EDD18DRAFT_1114189 [Armillaria luteobubalina]|uniref:Uncharacterized protein n=1 Tax=Armillaria luteobubalina TaxID=153913 RepID=A0AA39TBR8_9AGAR|nr:hypothetical protein EDD18DRAFT_1114189 [Armillaria luteobubalina]
MMEKPQESDFTAATGFGHEEEAFLAKNTVCFHLFESCHTFFGNLWLESIWDVFILYWPLAEQTHSVLAEHCKGLCWLYEHIDLEKRQTKQANIQFPQVYYPGPLEPWRMTINPLQPSQPLNIVPPPPFNMKWRAIHTAKLAIKARLHCLRLSEECHIRRQARSAHIRQCHSI